MWVFPSRDIHLVRNAQPNTIELRVFVQEPPSQRGAWTDVSTVGNIVVAFTAIAGPTGAPAISTLHGTAGGGPTPAVVTLAPGPGGAGQAWIVDVGYANSAALLEHGVMRVSEHDDIAALFAGDRLISMWAGESDRQLTVYARFTDNAFEDITAHPYLKYRVDPPTLATVDHNEGRITALTEGIGSVFVSTWDGRFEVQVGLAVAPPLNPGGVPASSEQLRRRTAKHRATLYVLAEGYQDHARFFEHAHKAVDEWMRTQPYARLADQFDAVGVFLSSPQTKITIASPVTSTQVSDPKRSIWEGATFSVATSTVPPERMLTRDTIFGLMAGSRLSTPLVPTSRQAAAPPFKELFVPDSARTVHPDPRRLGRFAIDPREGYASFITRFLAGAGHTYGPEDRIVMLIDDRVLLGTSFGVLGLGLDVLTPPRPMTALGIRNEADLPVIAVVANAPLLDRDPDPRHDVGRTTFKASVTGSVIAHELAHTYHLGDEYENRLREEHYDDPVAIGGIEENENLHTDRVMRLDANRNLRQPPKTVDVTKIKWNVHRIKKGTPVASFVSDPPGSPVATTLILTVAPEQVRRWKPGERAFVRNTVATRTSRADPVRFARFTSIPAQIVTTDPQHNTIRISVPAGTQVGFLFGPSPLLYIPQRTKEGADLALIDPTVLAFIAANGPFPKPTDCKKHSEQDDDDVPCPDIPGFKRPSVHAEAIGLYEGGADISCGVYRPTGRCKMRNQDSFEYIVDDQNKDVYDPRTGRIRPKGHWAVAIVNFCFVCQYMLVDLLDPSQHEWLDTKYPKDC